jgi:hypothetical protein
MECRFVTDLGRMCGLGCTEEVGHCYLHINQIEEATYCYDLIVARGMPKQRSGDDPGMPSKKVEVPREDPSPNEL